MANQDSPPLCQPNSEERPPDVAPPPHTPTTDDEPPEEPEQAGCKRTACPTDCPSPHTPDSTDGTHYFRPATRWVQSFLNNDFIRFTSHASGPATSRYRVITALGSGSYASVWLAVDQAPPSPEKTPKYVAIKIPKRPVENREEECLRKLGRGRLDWWGRDSVIRLYDSFDADTSKGKCRALVMELGGESVDGMGCCTLDVAVAIFRQCVDAVADVHDQGFACGDLDLVNMVFAYPDSLDCSEKELTRAIRAARAKRNEIQFKKESLFDPHSPVPPGPKSLRIKLIDFGEAFTGEKLKVRTHLRNAAPEVTNKKPATKSSDIWALGCIFWHIWTGSQFMGSADPYLASWEQVRINDEFTRKSRQARRAGIEERIFSHVDFAGPGFDREDHRRVNAILGLMLDTLEPDPANRPNAWDLLQYPLFSLPPRERKAQGAGVTEPVPRKRKAKGVLDDVSRFL